MLRILLLTVCLLTSLVVLVAQKTDTAFTSGIARHREHYKEEFVIETRSPLTEQDTALLDFFSPDPSWLIAARFERTPDTEPFDMPSYSGRSAKYRQYGTIYFEKSGKTYSLQLYQNIRFLTSQKYYDYLFLPFNDSTNDDSTYGGGRYLDLRLGDIGSDNILTVDFNKAYNPWCAYSDGYNCPIPPATNHLDLAVEAGEKKFRGEKKH